MELILSAHAGLGNQLFQYAALLYYGKRFGAEMRVMIKPPENANSYGFPRPFLLSHFSIRTPIRELSLAERLLIYRDPVLKAILTPIKLPLQIGVFTEDYSSRYSFAPDIPVGRRVRRLYLVGYWQTYIMVEEVAAELRSELVFSKKPREKTVEVLQQIKRSVNPVSIHVRRGDSTVAATKRVSLPIEYYLRNIDECRQRLDNPTFFVFSDEMKFAKEYLPRTINAVFVEHNDDFSAHEDLLLMSSCRHHIIANSTFSWWGAWLSRGSDKMVFAPKQWYQTKDSYYPELLPPSWNLVDVASDLEPASPLPQA
jgi:Glycosyl transferase family 11